MSRKIALLDRLLVFLSTCFGLVDPQDKSATPAVLPVEWTTAERLRLNFPPHSAPSNQKLRLACQVLFKS